MVHFVITAQWNYSHVSDKYWRWRRTKEASPIISVFLCKIRYVWYRGVDRWYEMAGVVVWVGPWVVISQQVMGRSHVPTQPLVMGYIAQINGPVIAWCEHMVHIHLRSSVQIYFPADKHKKPQASVRCFCFRISFWCAHAVNQHLISRFILTDLQSCCFGKIPSCPTSLCLFTFVPQNLFFFFFYPVVYLTYHKALPLFCYCWL